MFLSRIKAITENSQEAATASALINLVNREGTDRTSKLLYDPDFLRGFTGSMSEREIRIVERFREALTVGHKK